MNESLFRKYINLMNQTEDIDLTEDAILTKPTHTEFLIDNHISNNRRHIFEDIRRISLKHDLTLPIDIINNYKCEFCGETIIFERSYNSTLCSKCDDIILPNRYLMGEVIYESINSEYTKPHSNVDIDFNDIVGYRIIELKDLKGE